MSANQGLSKVPPTLDTSVDLLREQTIGTRHGVLSSRLYRDASGTVGMALWVGELGGTTPVSCRVHSSCFTSEGLCGLDCDCVAQLDSAMAAIAKEKRGVIFYLLQEGRGAGLPNKARDRSMVQKSSGTLDTYAAYAKLGLLPDPRSYAAVKPMSVDLGIVAPLLLMTNNPAKIGALTRAGLEVVRVELVAPASPYNSHYIAAKAKFGHLIASPEVGAMPLPSGYADEQPAPARLGRFVRAASYLLPVRVGSRGIAWFRATSYVDEISGHDRMILSHSSRSGVAEIRHVFRDGIEDRIRGDGPEVRGYRDALGRIVGRGAGAVLAIPGDPRLLLDEEGPSHEDDQNLLHADGRARGAETVEEVA